MGKEKKVYICRNCGAEHPKWQGRCDSCGQWNTLEENIVSSVSKAVSNRLSTNEAIEIHAISAQNIPRKPTKDSEFDDMLGGGLVPGSIGLIGGQPGIGKSTLLLQLSLNLDIPIVYVSGEESVEQIKMRADRMGNSQNQNCYLLAETKVESILKEIKKINPDWVIIDSIQTLQSIHSESTPGSISQIRESTNLLNEFAKQRQIPITLIGHITKEGVIAGPKLLEHMVDYVFQFEGEKQNNYRLVRSIKNRFGSTDQLAIYEMKVDGLHTVENPSMVFMEEGFHELSGSAIATTLEGNRPLLIEVQALVASAVYGTPQRSTTGFDLNRLHMLLAVLEKRAGFFFNQQDVFLNIAGGFKIQDPSLDLAVIAALVSSNEDENIPKSWTFCGEVGLSGEVRPVARIELRVAEAQKMGFKRIFIPTSNKNALLHPKPKIEVVSISKVVDLIGYLV